MSNQSNTLKMSELTNNNNAVAASVEMAEKALKNARVMAETAFGMAKFNLESVERELRTAETLALCDQTIANIKERIGIAERELEASRDVMQRIRRAHINVKATMGYGDLQGLEDCLEADKKPLISGTFDDADMQFGIFVDTENIETDHSA
tara:strand:+ start:88 stop:540 length:453 start_codon:yes stop_codon:yes gene_type:complete